MATASRNIYYKDDNISLEFEYFGEDILIHSNVTKFTHTILKDAIVVFSMFLNECADGGYKRVFTVTPNPKYAKIFGGRKVNTLSYLNKEYEVIEWDLRQLP